MQRVLVVGISGSGKTTVAGSLAARLRVPLVELDALQHGAGWTARPTFAKDVDAATRGSAWVVDVRLVRDPALHHAPALHERIDDLHEGLHPEGGRSSLPGRSELRRPMRSRRRLLGLRALAPVDDSQTRTLHGDGAGHGRDRRAPIGLAADEFKHRPAVRRRDSQP
jgi:hypothetical protein